MKDLYKNTQNTVERQRLELAAKNLQHYLKIQEEQVTLENIVSALRDTHINAATAGPDDFTDILNAQARLLDATFQYYLNAGQNGYTKDDKVNMAFKAQRQMLSTLNTWRHLEKHLKKAAKNKKTAKRTEQNAPMDR